MNGAVTKNIDNVWWVYFHSAASVTHDESWHPVAGHSELEEIQREDVGLNCVNLMKGWMLCPNLNF